MIELLKPISTPLIWILVLLVLGLFFSRHARKNKASKFGWYLLLLGTLTLLFFSNRLVSNRFVYFLESRYEPASTNTLFTLDIMVVLNGGIRRSNIFNKNFGVVPVTFSRMSEGIKAFNQSNAKNIILSGAGSNSGTKLDSQKDGEAMKNLAIQLGVPEENIIVEPNSFNTMEHAIELVKLFPPEKKLKIGLVTSALHMLRSKKAFSKIFQPDSIVPIPVNYTYSSPTLNITSFIPSSAALSQSTFALHELIGILWLSIRY
ncbi:MAG: YdcF family protein [Planctomycetes bacterium]|nr:YdcF family protein [Planctomycetota bacterium]